MGWVVPDPLIEIVLEYEKTYPYTRTCAGGCSWGVKLASTSKMRIRLDFFTSV